MESNNNIVTKTKPLALKEFKDALITDVELKDGTTTQAILIFNRCELSFEEMNRGINDSLSYVSAKTAKTKIYSIKNGKLEASTEFDEVKIKSKR